MAMRTGRLEKRVPLAVPLRLACQEHRGYVESTHTENVSPFGARVVTRHKWRPDEQLLVSSPQGDFSSSARVVYCEQVRDEQCVIGLRLQSPFNAWSNSRSRNN